MCYNIYRKREGKPTQPRKENTMKKTINHNKNLNTIEKPHYEALECKGYTIRENNTLA